MEINLKKLIKSLEEEERIYIEEASKKDHFIKGKYELAKIKTELELQAEKKRWDDISNEANRVNKELKNDAFAAAIMEAKEKEEKEVIDLMEYLKAKKRVKRPPVIKKDWKSYRPGEGGNLIKIEDIEVKNNKNTVKLNLDTTPFKQKPFGGQAGGVQNRLNNNIKEVTIEEFAAGVALKGYSFKAAQIEGSKNEDWIGQDIFALDIDNKYKENEKTYPYLSMEEAYNRCIKYNIKPLFMYPSFSSTSELNKFRIVFRVPTTVTDLRIRKVIFNALINIFPERDIACKDLTRVFFGGCQQIYKLDKDAVLEPVELIQSMISYIRDTDAAHAARKIKTFCAETGLNTINNMPYVIYSNFNKVGDSTFTSNIIYRTEHHLTTFGFNIEKIEYKDIDKSNKKYKNIDFKEDFKEELIQRFNFDELESKCQLWDEFITGSRWCYHSEVLGIATNMWRVKGAEKKMLEAIRNNNDYKDTYNKTNTIKSMRKYGYAPQRCENFCPYYNSCNSRCNMLTIVNNKQNNIRKVEEITPKKLKDAEIELDTIINDVLNNEKNTIDIIAAPTGIGKTTALVKNKELLKHNTIIAYPNHKLGKEIVEKIGLHEGEYIHLKDLDIEDKTVLTEYRRLQSLGAYGAANKYLEKHKDNLAIKYNTASDDEKNKILNEINKIMEYMFYKKEAKTTNKVIFCSHAKALTIKNNNVNQIIFDEDIFLSSCFSNIDINLNDLSVAINAAKINEDGSTYKQLLSLKEKVDVSLNTPNTIVNIPTFVINDKEVNEIIKYNPHLNINIKELLKTKIIISDVKGKVMGAYIKELPNKKCIVLSATANKTVYQEAFKDRKVNYIDLGNVEQQGQIILHYKSFSKQSLNNKFENLLEQIREEAPGVKNVITYKNFSSKFNDSGFNTITHFGACTGLDAYNGQDLIVAGTPRPDGRIYPLLVNLLKPGTTTIENKQENVNVINNGWEFSIFTYGEENGTTAHLLQEVQFYLIESEIVQAVGRARTLRSNATVHLFSNYPLRECILYKDSKKATTQIAA